VNECCSDAEFRISINGSYRRDKNEEKVKKGKAIPVTGRESP
jgi:hypothetical protein